jgi:hypothetical protein
LLVAASPITSGTILKPESVLLKKRWQGDTRPGKPMNFSKRLKTITIGAILFGASAGQPRRFSAHPAKCETQARFLHQNYHFVHCSFLHAE